jgi:FkbH-like protein
MKAFKHFLRKYSTKKNRKNIIGELTNQSSLKLREVVKPKLLLLGTCQAERLYETAQTLDWQITHQLCDFNLYTYINNLDSNTDMVLLNPTLRVILGLADANGNGDILIKQLAEDYQTFTNKAVESLNNLLSRYIDHYNTATPVCVISFIEPPPTASGFAYRNRHNSVYTLIRTLNDELESLCHTKKNTYYLEVNDIRTLMGDRLAYDGYQINYTHASYYASRARTHHLNQALLQRIENYWRIINQIDPIKLIITDLDNTLWQGVLAEQDSIESWRHTEGWPLGYAEALLQCKQRGILLAICSKNNEAQTLVNFRTIWRTRITPEDFCSIQINWDSKANNVAKILRETNILPQNILFIDDNPLEIAEVKQAFPSIRTLTIPQGAWRAVLLYSTETQMSNALTDESKQRTALIRAKKSRDSDSLTMPRDEFLVSLKLELSSKKIHNINHKSFERAIELLNKTNQFNSTGKRWSIAEISEFLKTDGLVMTFSAKDRFAEHGIIAVILLKDCIIEQFVLSCRVFGLGIEQSIIYQLNTEQFHPNKLKIYWRETDKNHSFLSFIKTLPIENNVINTQQLTKPNWIRIKYDT